MNDEEKQKLKEYQKEYREANRDTKLEYYKNNIELMRKNARERYRSLPEDKKKAVIEHAKNKYHNMTDEQKQKYKDYQKEYQKKYYEAKKLNNKITKNDNDYIKSLK